MSAKAVKVKIAGRIDENSNFPILSSVPQSVCLNLAGVSMINSTGVKRWVEWISTLPEVPLFVEGAPPIIIDQCNMVYDFIPQRTKFISFFVPYYSEETDETKYVLYKAGEDYFYQENGVEINYREVSATGGEELLELDVIKEKYFSFLTSYKSP